MEILRVDRCLKLIDEIEGLAENKYTALELHMASLTILRKVIAYWEEMNPKFGKRLTKTSINILQFGTLLAKELKELQKNQYLV